MHCASSFTIVLLILVLANLANAQVTGTLGTGVAVSANTPTTINFNGGITQLVITTSAAATVTFDLLLQTAFSLDANLNQYTLGSLASAAVNIGYSLDVSSGSIVSATVTSDALAASFLTAITGNVFGVLYYDASTDGYLEIPATVTMTKATFSVPFKGKYALAVRASTAPAARLFNNAMSVAANTASSVQFHSSKTAKLVITQTTTADSSFTAAESSSAPSGASASVDGRIRISNFFDLTSSASSGISNQLQYTYSTADAAKADVNTFAWYFYNTATRKWEADGSSTVDVNARVVTHASTHFSSWVIAAEGSLSVAMLPAALLVALALFASMML